MKHHNRITGRIDDLAVSLDQDDQGRDRLLTVHPTTRRASLSVFVGGKQVSTILGRVKSGYLITDKTLPNGRRWIRLAGILTLGLWMGGLTGCTMQVDTAVHWPGKLNAIDHHETSPAKTIYRGYSPPMQMDPPAGYTSR